MRTTLWRYRLGGGCVLALASVYLPFPALRAGSLVLLCLAAIVATLASVRLWRPAQRLPFYLFAAGEAVGFAAGSLGSSAAVTRAGGSPAAAALTMVAYVIGIAGYAVLIRTRSPGRDRASLIDATVISTGVGMLAWVFLASRYSVDASLPLVERVLSVLYVVLDVLVLALVIRLAIGGGDRTRAYLLMTAGWLVLVAADAGRAVLVLLGTYDPASPVEAGWLVAYALWGAAVLDPSVATLTDPVPAPRTGLTRTRLVSLAAASLMAPAILAIQAVADQRLDVPVIVTGCAALFLLVLVRLADLVRENEATVRELRGTEGVLRASLQERDTLAAQLEHQAFHDSLTDLANRALFNDRVRHAPGQGAPGGDRPGRAVPRPGRLQGGQRQPRPRRRRPAAARGRGPAAQLPARARHRRPARRRRVRHPGRGHRPGHRPAARRAGDRHPGRALPPGRRPGHHPGQRRHRPRRAPHPGRGPAAAQRRHRHVRRQEPRQGHLRGLPGLDAALGPRPPRRPRRPGGRHRAPRAGGPLPADRRPAQRPGRGGRGAGPLAAAGPRAGPAGRVHPRGRGHRPGGGDRPVRAPPGQPPDGRLDRRRRPLLLHVNLSANHLLRGDLSANVAAALRDSGLAPDCLALEITESVLMHDLELGIVRLKELKRLGVHLAIDDFGTGYSSLAYLRQMPIDAVKIDKSFVDGVAGGPEESAVARAIIALAATLHLDTVAEGVEHPEQATALAELGCHLAQGYHFSRPVPAADMACLAGRQVAGSRVAGLLHPA